MRALYALTAMAFALFVMVGVLAVGSEQAQKLILWSALACATSQFIAQDDRRKVLIASVVVAYVGIGFAAWALVVL